jgi:hypothetical protein
MRTCGKSVRSRCAPQRCKGGGRRGGGGGAAATQRRQPAFAANQATPAGGARSKLDGRLTRNLSQATLQRLNNYAQTGITQNQLNNATKLMRNIDTSQGKLNSAKNPIARLRHSTELSRYTKLLADQYPGL